MDGPLKDKIALVTGSVQGIGLAIAQAFASAGMRIAVHGLADKEQGDKVIDILQAAGSPEARFFNIDMRDPEAIEAMMMDVASWGGADILVNNAGIQQPVSLEKAETSFWNDILAVNLSGAFHTMRLALPVMAEKGYGRVINIASVHGLVGSAYKAPYVTSKFGLIGLSKSAALEYATAGSKEQGGITVNCICPGWTETAIIEPQVQTRSEAYNGDRDAAIASLLAEKQPSQRISDPAEIGALALWLCAPIAHNITGAAIPVDGGWTAQ